MIPPDRLEQPGATRSARTMEADTSDVAEERPSWPRHELGEVLAADLLVADAAVEAEGERRGNERGLQLTDTIVPVRVDRHRPGQPVPVALLDRLLSVIIGLQPRLGEAALSDGVFDSRRPGWSGSM